MAVLERIMQLRGEGLTEPKIIETLRQEGVSPKEIYEGLTQSQIKVELSQGTEDSTEMNMDMQQSMDEPMQNNYAPEQQYQDQPQVEAGAPQPYQEYQEPPPQQQEYYPQYQEYQNQQSTTDISTISEIAEQIVDEKNVELKKQISEIKNFKEETNIELERLNKRLDKMESTMNDLQMAIIRKIGEYGENIKSISNEMHETQDSFSKIINPLTDNIRELQKITNSIETKNSKEVEEKPVENQTTPQTEDRTDQVRQRRTEPGFENYLR